MLQSHVSNKAELTITDFKQGTKPDQTNVSRLMTIRNVSEAKAELSALLVMVENGEEVMIARAGKPVARLTKIEGATEPRKLGALMGQIWISPEFDETDFELEKSFYEGSIEPTS